MLVCVCIHAHRKDPNFNPDAGDAGDGVASNACKRCLAVVVYINVCVLMFAVVVYVIIKRVHGAIKTTLKLEAIAERLAPHIGGQMQ